jgi:glycine dehydrogenase subunit 2
MHEVVVRGQVREAPDATTRDIAKRLIDYGFHPPTVYFPISVPEAMLIEPTETESKANLDAFIQAMVCVAREAVEDRTLLTEAPTTAPVRRLDEVGAARRPVLRYDPDRFASLRRRGVANDAAGPTSAANGRDNQRAEPADGCGACR